ncbi:hypothetical protein [Chryseobacterium salivictor]|uniref:hypothetical protein n=1 Tax=Chryseobacterium salivictor TaxID=2547600 RepID=UPI00105E989B|nr:hypothetical protein [Chryseobacterium salivictor]
MMKKIKINKAVLIYFSISWILGIFVYFFGFYKEDSFIIFWFFAVAFNAVINLTALIFLLILTLVFIENRKEFVTSSLVLLFNFPFIVTFIVLVNSLLE